MVENTDYSKLINQLGGGRKLTLKLKEITSENINEKTVYSWVRQGIPDRWKVAIARCALEKDILLDDKFLPPGLSLDNLISANNSIQIFSRSKVIKESFDEIHEQLDPKVLLDFYQKMLKIRRFEERVGQLYSMGLIGGFCHLYIGQEAVVVGFEEASNLKDSFITGYRCHAHMLVRGNNIKDIFSELLGKKNGVSRGKGGSMHMFLPEKNFYGGHGIVGAQVPIGTGIAFANKYLKNNSLSLVYFGDGAVNQGQVYESFNMASLWKLPVIYIIENNQYGMGTSVDRASAVKELFRRGESFGIEGYKVDGMDPVSVYRIAKEIIDKVRNDEGPKLIEVSTYRYRGHSMSDPGKYRSREEVQETRETRDPIERIKSKILLTGKYSEKELSKIDKNIREQIQRSAEEAISKELPHDIDVYSDVYYLEEKN